MRLFADENFPRKAVELLRTAGHDIAWAHEVCASADDANVLDLATQQGRVLVTLDKDFGELAFRARLPSGCGVVLFRVPPFPATIAAIAVRVFASDLDLIEHFIVVEPDRIRIRSLRSI